MMTVYAVANNGFLQSNDTMFHFALYILFYVRLHSQGGYVV